MKNLIILALFVPLLCYGQKFEVSEMAGYYSTNDGNIINNGFSNEVSLGYYLVKHFSIKALYEQNSWAAFGLAVDYHFNKWLYCGIEFKKLEHFPSYLDLAMDTFRYNNSCWGEGGYIGVKHKLSKHIFLNMQLGYDGLNLPGTETIPGGSQILGSIWSGNPSYDPAEYEAFQNTYHYFYLRVGLSCRF